MSEMNAYTWADRDDQRVLTEEEHLFAEAEEEFKDLNWDFSLKPGLTTTEGGQNEGAPKFSAVALNMWDLPIDQESTEKLITAAPMMMVLLRLLTAVYTDGVGASVKPFVGAGVSDEQIRVMWRAALVAMPQLDSAGLNALREYGVGNLPGVLGKVFTVGAL